MVDSDELGAKSGGDGGGDVREDSAGAVRFDTDRDNRLFSSATAALSFSSGGFSGFPAEGENKRGGGGGGGYRELFAVVERRVGATT